MYYALALFQRFFIKTFLIFFVPVFISGCDDIKYINAQDVIYAASSEAEISDIEIIINRLKEYKPSMFSEIKFDAKTREITFSKGAPEHEIIEYMSSNRGKLSIRKENSFISWVSNEHISTVRILKEDDQVSLLIGFTDAGGQLMSTMSEKNLGATLIIEIDSAVIMKAIVTTKLDNYLRLSPIDSPDILKKSILLRHGRLKNPVLLKKV